MHHNITPKNATAKKYTGTTKTNRSSPTNVRKETVAYRFAKRYENAPGNLSRDNVVRDIKRKMKDKRLNAENVRFLRHIVNYHARNVKGVPGHRPTVHTMMWPAPGLVSSRRRR